MTSRTFAQPASRRAILVAIGLILLAVSAVIVSVVAYQRASTDKEVSFLAAPSSSSWYHSRSSAVAPVDLTVPETRSGDTWSTRSYVANLNALELVAAIQTEHGRQPTIALLDVHSGRHVATLTFTAGSLFVRLRDKSHQLLVSEGARLLIFSLTSPALELFAEVPLPHRLGYPWFINAMMLSQSERYLYFPQRARADTVECQKPVFNGDLCDRDAVGILDLRTLEYVGSVSIDNGACALLLRQTGPDGATVQCGSMIQEIGPRGAEGVSMRLPAVPRPGTAHEVYLPRIVFAAFADAHRFRALSEDGVILDGSRDPLSLGVLPPGERVYGTPWQLSETLAAAITEPETGGPLRNLVVVDLRTGAPLHTTALPDGTTWAAVIDRERMLLLAQDHLGAHRLVQIDAMTGMVGETLALDPSLVPDAIDR